MDERNDRNLGGDLEASIGVVFGGGAVIVRENVTLGGVVGAESEASRRVGISLSRSSGSCGLLVMLVID